MPPIRLRIASDADSRQLLNWRNDPETRRASRNSQIIAWAEHDDWFKRGLNSPDRIMKVAEMDGQAVGVVRADRVGGEWQLSWTVAPEVRGRGVGGAMLKFFVRQLEGRLVALIHRDNHASLKIARAAGMARIEGDDKGEFERWGRDDETPNF